MHENNMNNDMILLGSRLKEVREYLNLSQQLVSEKTGMPRTAISAIECGKRKVSSFELAKLAKLYNYSVSYFLGEQEESKDQALQELHRAARELDETDRRELTRFAEFLRQHGRQRQKK